MSAAVTITLDGYCHERVKKGKKKWNNKEILLQINM
jgi:hypothetical protein